jgi:SpoVK/Ycf46/Vps4 family AAA+-type ATPase
MTTKCTKLAALKAVGGVLFIDEAYALANKRGSGINYGDEVIDTLTPIMTNYGGDLVVVMAGYEEEMKDMLERVNTGFASRFQRNVNFTDYNSKEMFEIFLSLAEKNYYKLENGAKERLIKLFKVIEDLKDNNRAFANARTVSSLFDIVRNRTSMRFTRDGGDPDLIIEEDIAISKEELENIGAI